jgi:hypothetical protein
VTRLGVFAMASMTCALIGCGGGLSSFNSASLTSNFVNCQSGETVKACVERLPSNSMPGGTVVFAAGVYPSGYTGDERITAAYVTLQGAAMPEYNSELTALTGGTIITGTLPVGADYFTARDLGIDVGSLVAGSTAADGFVMANNGQVIGRPPFKHPVLENLTVLGVNVPGAHTVLIENVTGAYVHNIRCRFQTHCFAFKGDGVIQSMRPAGSQTTSSSSLTITHRRATLASPISG